MNTKPEITFSYLVELTQKAWKVAQKEWPELPKSSIPVFEIKSKKDMENVGIGYKMSEFKDMDLNDVGMKVVYEVGVQAGILRHRPEDRNKENIEATMNRLFDLISNGGKN